MSARKPRGDSQLKTLPTERQTAIVEHALGHTLAETAAWLAEDGLQVSRSALSEFLSWYQLRDQLRRNQDRVETLLADLQHDNPTLPPERLFDIGQSVFSTLAIQSNDPRVWSMTQRLALKAQQLELDRQKFRRETAEAFLQWAEDQRAREIVTSAETNTSKIERLGQLMFGDDWK